jgi:hypothetical protein
MLQPFGYPILFYPGKRELHITYSIQSDCKPSRMFDTTQSFNFSFSILWKPSATGKPLSQIQMQKNLSWSHSLH